MSTILVTGGTGTLGREVVAALRAAGHSPRIASRRPRPGDTPSAEWATVDYRTGAGLAEAVAGVDGIVHCAGEYRGNDVDRALIGHARRSGGEPHLVYISIVGVDRIPFGYYRTKYAAERLVEASELPWTILRATQFHNLVDGMFGVLAKAPVLLLPSALRCQPVEVTEVAERLAELATGPAAGRVDDVGGPEVRDARSLAGAVLAARGKSRPMLPFGLPGRTYRAFKDGHHLAPEHAVGKITFEEFLAARSNQQHAS
jgi:uncharacterized protein YbjT (DUF2867 family)